MIINLFIMEIPKVIVSIWGCGPSYRDRIKFTIQRAIDTGYPHILPYIILTDLPSDFDDLRSKTDKIIDVIDINVEREKYSPWSKDLEYICQEKYDEQKYGEEFMNALRADKHFSYATHRFAFPRIAELGYNRFLHSDGDVDILYNKIVDGKLSEEEFWEQFNTPVNSVRGLDLQKYTLDGTGAHYLSVCVLTTNVLRYEMRRRHPELSHLSCLKFDYTQTECGFRYYHLLNTSMIMEYLKLWDEIVHLMIPHSDLKQVLGGGGYVLIDNAMHAVLADIFGIEILNFGKEYHHVNLPNADRYFFPRSMGVMIDGKEHSFNAAKTRSEFLEINKEMVDVLTARGEVF